MREVAADFVPPGYLPLQFGVARLGAHLIADEWIATEFFLREENARFRRRFDLARSIAVIDRQQKDDTTANVTEFSTRTGMEIENAFAELVHIIRETEYIRSVHGKSCDEIKALSWGERLALSSATRNDAEAAFDAFVETYAVKYDKAVDCLSKDRTTLLAFYDFPAEHWRHLRTSNPIESSFATVRHRTVRSKGCLSNKTALAMIFKLAQAAEKSWHRLRGYNQLPKLILGVKFRDGIEVVKPQTQSAAA